MTGRLSAIATYMNSGIRRVAGSYQRWQIDWLQRHVGKLTGNNP